MPDSVTARPETALRREHQTHPFGAVSGLSDPTHGDATPHRPTETDSTPATRNPQSVRDVSLG